MRRVTAWIVTLALVTLGLGPAPLRPPHASALPSPPVLADARLGAPTHQTPYVRISATRHSAPQISAKGAVLWDPADDLVLFSQDPDGPRRMASTTKMIVAGQVLPMPSMLAGLILRSGNDAAVAIAEHVAGSEAAFVEKMNARAHELGLESTAFLDASGLTDDPGHHTSPLDLARLAAVAMQHPEFASWAGAAKLDVPGLGVLHNRNELLRTYHGATGVKTGYTALSGLCLVASATRDGRTLYAVVLGSQNSFADVAALLDHGFTAFRRPAPVGTGMVATTYRWSDTQVGLVAHEPLARTVPAGSDVVWRTVLHPLAARPVPAGAVLGHAELVVNGRVVDTVDLHAQHAVSAPPGAARGELAGAFVQDTIRAFTRLRPFDRAVP
jgi:D-alanyl-D-alanine carboxypeptidase (penicillin-binding protein 5/6)